MKHTPEEIKYRLSDLGAQIGNIAIEYITELEKENAELKEQNRKLLESCEGATIMYEHLTKAKELLREIIDTPVFNQMGGELYENEGYTELVEETEQFLARWRNDRNM